MSTGNPLPKVKKIHLLSRYSDDTDRLASLKCEDPIKLPVLSPNGPVNKLYSVILSRYVHEEFQTDYMIRHDPIHYEHRYTVWLGIDLDSFGSIDAPAKFFQVLEKSLLAERMVLQENPPPVIIERTLWPTSIRRGLWMVMYGYFGNWYESEGKKMGNIGCKEANAPPEEALGARGCTACQ
ncbi:unnamed protein product [Penicillium egyptiacum]|uniref:Uncharacterized protein n=1 Tax=Penicillium egyptiacum TaxID=1303716 RepID=A0A9W4P0W0_9EURO|nr:unnamed protein product [Penicillium egyptiacum]